MSASNVLGDLNEKLFRVIVRLKKTERTVATCVIDKKAFYFEVVLFKKGASVDDLLFPGSEEPALKKLSARVLLRKMSQEE